MEPFDTGRRHLDEVGESYAVHAGFALRAAGTCLVAALGLDVHALVPGWCVRTGSARIVALHDALRRREAGSR